MIDVKNPFGIRNGEVITINDLTDEERGKKCNCVCPSCRGAFLARMGEERVRHFAHDGDACDEVKAYLCGLYQLLHEYLDKEALCLPAAIIQFPLNGSIKLDSIKFLNQKQCNESRKDQMEVSKEIQIAFDSSEIIYDDQGYPEVIFARKGNHKLAVKIKPPDTVCKDFHIKRYQDYSTVEVTFDDAYILSNSGKHELFSLINNRQIKLHWLYSDMWKDKLDEIEKRRQCYQLDREIESKRREIDRLIKERLDEDRRERGRLERERLDEDQRERERLKRERLDEDRRERERLASMRLDRNQTKRQSTLEEDFSKPETKKDPIAEEIRKTGKPYRQHKNIYYLCKECKKSVEPTYVSRFVNGTECGFCICKGCSLVK